MTVNKALLVGHVGKTPEIRNTKDGKEIASFSVATTQRWKDKTGEAMSKTEWHKIVVFNQGLVKLVKSYVNKGSKLYVEGMLETREWTDDKGNKRYNTEIMVKNYDGTIKLLDSKNDTSKKNEENTEDQEVEEEFDDIIPF